MNLTVIQDCNRCSLREGAGQVVWGECPPNVPLLVVSAGPTAEDDLMGEPYYDRSGALFRKLLEESGFPRGSYGATYLVKCHGKAKSEHVSACSDWLGHEIRRVRPKVILSLGIAPARQLIGLKSKDNLDTYLGTVTEIPHSGHSVAVWYGTQAVLNGGKRLRSETAAFLGEIRRLCV